MRVFRSATGSRRIKGSVSTIWDPKIKTTTSSDQGPALLGHNWLNSLKLAWAQL